MSYQPKSYRKFLATSVSAAMVATAFAAVPANVVNAESDASFSDVSAQHWASAEIYRLVNAGVISGYEDGTFKPGQPINRGQAATLLAKAAGLEIPTSVESTPFSDVSAGNNFAGVVTVMQEVGFIGGYEDGTFRAGLDITREQMASILVRTFGLEDKGEDVTVGDLDSAHSSHQANIQILAQYGITSTADGNFRPKETVQRAQFAAFLDRALAWQNTQELGLTGLNFVDANTVEVSFNSELTEADLEALEFAFNPELEVTAKALKTAEVSTSETKSTVVLTTATQVEGTSYQLWVNGNQTNLVGVGVPPFEPSELAVESVSANNLKTLYVEFNQEVDKVSAETLSNYTLTTTGTASLTGGSAKLLDDNKTVQLTLGTEAAQQNSAEVEVKNVKAVNGTEVATTKKEVTFFDTVAPSVEDINVVGPRKVEVSFSEPLKTAPTVKLDNGSISSTVQINPNDRSKAIVEFGIEPSLGLHTLEIEGGEDYADFKVVKTTKEFTYAVDETAPTVSVDKAEPNQVTLKFSKPVSVKTAGDISLYHTVNNSAAYVGTNFTAVNAVNGYSDTFTVDFATPVAEGTTKLFLNTKANALEDAWGNDVASTELSVTVAIDKVAPQVSTVTASTDKKFEVVFSKEVNSTDAVAPANFVLTDAEGKTVSLANASFSYDNAKKTTTITLPNNLQAGNYTLTVKDVKDTTFAENKLTSQNVSVAVPDTTTWDIDNNAVIISADNKKIRVQFNEAMSAEGLTTLANYSLRDANGAAIAFPADSKVVAINSSTVEIQLGAAVTTATDVRVSGSLKDAAGNVRSNTDYKQVGISADAIDANSLVADSAKTVSNRTVEFQLNQELQGSLNPAHFTIGGNEVFGGASYVNNQGKATVTLTLKSSETAFAANAAPTVVAAVNALTNVFGTKNVGTINVVTTDGIAPNVAKNNAGELLIADDAATAGANFIITFDETLGASTALWTSDLVITDAEGKTLKAGDDFTVTSSSNELHVDLAGKYDAYLGSITVGSVATPVYIRDLAGNAAKSFATTTLDITVLTDVSANYATAQGIDAVQGVDTLTFVAGWAADDTIEIDGVTLTGAAGASTANTFDTSTDTAAAIASAVKASVDLNAELSAKYDVSDDGAGELTFTQKVGKESATALQVVELTAGAGTATEANVTPGIVATQEVGTITVTNGSSYNGTVPVTVNGNTTNVTVAADDTAAQVAAKIAAALTVEGYTVANPAQGNTVTLTSNVAGNVADLTVSVN